MTMAHRLAMLERRVPRGEASPYVVMVQDGETEAEAVARTKPGRGYFLLPSRAASVEAWAAEAAEVLAR